MVRDKAVQKIITDKIEKGQLLQLVVNGRISPTIWIWNGERTFEPNRSGYVVERVADGFKKKIFDEPVVFIEFPDLD